MNIKLSATTEILMLERRHKTENQRENPVYLPCFSLVLMSF